MYRLTYFDFVGGRGEPARLIFAAAGVKYTDKRIKFEDWSAFKKSKLDLIYLRFHDSVITESCLEIFTYNFEKLCCSSW